HTRFSRDWSSDVCSSDLHFLNREKQGQTMKKLCSIPFALLSGGVVLALLAILGAIGGWGFDRYFPPLCFGFSMLWAVLAPSPTRSEERRVGKECSALRVP